MDEKQIIELYWNRSESAVAETEKKYGRYCRSVAYNILGSDEDSEECVNDAYLRAWEAIPPRRPKSLPAFLGAVTRNLALNRFEKYSAAKRGGLQTALALEELEDCVPSREGVEESVDGRLLTEALNRFLAGLSAEKRRLFMRRYWYMSSVKNLAKEFGMSESGVKTALLRMRNELKELLKGEGIVL